ncbi:MAG: helix-turn-helix domain-containing protein [Fimbriimonas sp.]
MTEGKTFLEQVQDDRAATDPEYAAVRPKMDFVLKLIVLRKKLGLTQEEVAKRLGVPRPRVNEIETKPDRVSLDRIHAYARAMGADFQLRMPGSAEELVAASAGPLSAIDIKQVSRAVRELATLLSPVTTE